MFCPLCGNPLFLPADQVRAAFDKMRKEGWIE